MHRVIHRNKGLQKIEKRFSTEVIHISTGLTTKKTYNKRKEPALVKIVCKQEKLIKALNIVSKAISPTSTLGITKGILIRAEGDMEISLSATDIQIAITTTTSAVVNEFGGIVVSAKLFTDLVRKFPPGDILISTNDNNVNIRTDVSTYDFGGAGEGEFPRIESAEEGVKFKMMSSVLRELIEGTCFAASVDESRGILTGALFEVSEGEAMMVALDGYRMAVRKEYIEELKEESIQAIIPARMLREAGKILGEPSGEDQETEIEIGENRAVFRNSETVVRMNLLSGDFVKYKYNLPQDNSIILKAGKKELQGAVERTSLLRSDGKNSFVRFSINDDLLSVFSRATEGTGDERVSVEKTGEDLEIGFDAKFVSDALRAIDEDNIVMEYNTGVSPCLIRPEEGDRFSYLILPVRLSTVNI
jgi:DNA polymerase-3 subunit beta